MKQDETLNFASVKTCKNWYYIENFPRQAAWGFPAFDPSWSSFKNARGCLGGHLPRVVDFHFHFPRCISIPGIWTPHLLCGLWTPQCDCGSTLWILIGLVPLTRHFLYRSYLGSSIEMAYFPEKNVVGSAKHVTTKVTPVLVGWILVGCHGFPSFVDQPS